MKIYIVGNDGSGTEYSPSVEVFFCDEAIRGTQYIHAKNSNSAHKTKAFVVYADAKAYYDKLVDGQRSHAVIMGEVELYGDGELKGT